MAAGPSHWAPGSAPLPGPPAGPPVGPPSPVGRWVVLGGVALAWLLLLGVAVGRSIVHDGGGSTEAGLGRFTPVGEEIPDSPGTFDPGTPGPQGTSGIWDPVDAFGFGAPVPIETPAGPGVAVPGDFADGPRFVGGLLVVPTARQIVALDPASGEHVWTSGACWEAQWPTPIQGSVEAPAVVFECVGQLLALDAATGDELWRREPPIPVERTRVGPVVVMLQNDDEVVALDLRTGEERGRWPGLGDANAVSNRDTAFVSTDVAVYAFALDTGEQLWIDRMPTTGLAVTDEAVWARAKGHWLSRLDPATGAEVWRSEWEPYRLDWSEIIGLSDTSVVIQSTEETKYLTVYDRTTGQKMWSHDPARGAFLNYAVGSRFVVFVEHGDGSTAGATTVREATDGSVVADLGMPGSGFNAATDGDVVAAIVGVYPDTALHIVRIG